MKRYRFALAIDPDTAMAYYQGHIQHVIATTAQGKRVQFPARLLRNVITREGIYGEFELTTDDHNGNAALRRVA